ncbi:DUF1697 domain-containing protein [Ornithinimicrobium cerasi]|uniref:DUF1697 domain-containing protein n=1 Tax=Ornithinimicrobium cerasi TaxID=2248773 RepID=UPI00192A17D7|nr:DUF1697 domain-containing protein [Ornithinimicrobium cerasi]
MTRYIAFLRAINLGAHRKFPKDAIRACVEGAGFRDVATHINTGNVLLSTSRRSRASVENALEEAFLADRGFPVPTIAFRPEELVEVVRAGEELATGRPEVVRHYVSLLKEEPGPGVSAQVTDATEPGVAVLVVGRAVHVVTDHVLGQGGPQSDRLERLLGVATTRNQTVLSALVQKWC